MNLRRRLAALEKRLTGGVSEPTTLTMPDGSIVNITGGGDCMLDLLGVALGGRNMTSAQSKQLDLIRRCTDSGEPGGSRLVDLVRCFLLGPAGEADA